MAEAWFINGKRYQRFDIDSDKAVGAPIPLASMTGWPGWASVDCAINLGNGKVYFFLGEDYCRYDILKAKIDRKPAKWKKFWAGMPSHWQKIDAAHDAGTGKVFFFSGTNFVGFDVAKDKVVDNEAAITTRWPGLLPKGWTGLDAAVSWGNRKVYFFHGSDYVRFDEIKHAIDKKCGPTSNHWTGLMPTGWSKFDAAITLDPEAERMAIKLEAKLKNKSVGYAYVIYGKGRQQKVGWAGHRITATDAPLVNASGALPFTANTEMGIGSITKSLTAMAVARIAAAKGVSLDSPIGPWLPHGWKTHQSVADLTFVELLTHRSGLFVDVAGVAAWKAGGYHGGRPFLGDAEYYKDLRAAVEKGTTQEQRDLAKSEPVGAEYRNVNFCLCRVILPKLGIGELIGEPNADQLTADQYKQIMVHHVFNPSGVSGADCRANVDEWPFVYSNFTTFGDKPGINWYGMNNGDDTTLKSGAGGWKLNVVDLGRVINTWAMTDRIVKEPVRKEMRLKSFGGYVGNGIKFTHNGSAGAENPAADPATVPPPSAGYYNVYQWLDDDVICVVMANSLGVALEGAISAGHTEGYLA